MTDSRIRVVIVDDQGMVRTGFGVFLNSQPDIEVVGEASNGEEALRVIAGLRPDVVLMDVRMPVMDGLEATRRLLAGEPAEPGASGEPGKNDDRPKVLMLTTFDLDDYVYEALRAGASGFLLKDASAAELSDAVRIIAAGDALLSPSVTRRLIAEFSRLGAPRSPSRTRLEELTERETEVLTLVARGLSNTEIATELVVAEQTVKTHFGRILMKLGLRDRPQAIVYAYETGLVRPGG
ncbi:DNA-binding response regulator [Actinomadura sp. NBRC 104412]|uniref:response regulator transcription factor n=1 Tax=Actinomadura sp. NBRC 104412 TaxID=3032203 RepID=UPI0024A1D613|nr:response regulator transcription factor [Actinomadura sp. NBRC 104412]GLZ05844.1 DNA-binding response regulator [Actinomadura sp. NBRC 104412]